MINKSCKIPLLTLILLTLLITSTTYACISENSRQGPNRNFINILPGLTASESRSILTSELSIFEHCIRIGVITKDPIGFNGGNNLWGYANNNPVVFTDPMGQDALDCMADCIENNDPAKYAIAKVLLLIGGMPIPKTIVADLFEAVGNIKAAGKIRASLTLPGVNPYTSIPSALSLQLRMGAGSALRAFGRYAQPVMIGYGLALVAVEAHCAKHCFCNEKYDPATGNIFNKIEDFFK